MCTTCGCGNGETKVGGQTMHEHIDADGRVYQHVHASESHGQNIGEDTSTHHHKHSHSDLHFGTGVAHSHAPGLSQNRMIKIERDILAKNDSYAEKNRTFFQNHGILGLNLVSSPGAGKTTLLVETLKALNSNTPVAVIEGDQQTTNDAERIREVGAPAVQINTGKGCHLDAQMVGEALTQITLPESGLMLIENVGNLVCPAAFDLGEAAKVVVLSVTEGEDKPLKYPDMFRAASLLLLNKSDLLPYLNFNVDQVIENAKRVNPDIQIIRISATTGEGMAAWLKWLSDAHLNVNAGDNHRAKDYANAT